MFAFGGKPDIEMGVALRPLLTLSGQWRVDIPQCSVPLAAVLSFEPEPVAFDPNQRPGVWHETARHGERAASGDAGHCAALVAIDRNGRDCRNAQLFSGIDFTKN